MHGFARASNPRSRFDKQATVRRSSYYFSDHGFQLHFTSVPLSDKAKPVLLGSRLRLPARGRRRKVTDRRDRHFEFWSVASLRARVDDGKAAQREGAGSLQFSPPDAFSTYFARYF
jgi:hypothetical protein